MQSNDVVLETPPPPLHPPHWPVNDGAVGADHSNPLSLNTRLYPSKTDTRAGGPGAAGAAAVVAESYARIFFRNSVATGEVFPLESEVRICEECRTGDVVTIELGESRLINHTTGKEYSLKPTGDAGPVIEAGGIFAYARKTGMIPMIPS
ncbi:isopropylmalate isomerase 2 [Actinidia rufa]|uniref:Isopropylmalate isomerase 2 n=1 Tax=Actinidia rufa TaxID=165716 RepID=A0A7J0FTR4_9ERIC|nr:isopropylmalate isomerase 2 [Actinidia rufa]